MLTARIGRINTDYDHTDVYVDVKRARLRNPGRLTNVDPSPSYSKAVMCRSNMGFTLIEVVLSLAIASVILTIAYQAVRQIIQAKQILDDERDTSMMANAVLSRMCRELQLATSDATLLPPRERLTDTSRLDEHVAGEEKRMGDKREGDSITFMANEGGQYVPDGLTHAGVVQITYRVEKDPDNSSRDAPYYLIRDEVPFLGKGSANYAKAYKQIMTFPVTKDLISLSFRYYDQSKSQWLTEWKDQRFKLPDIIQFEIQLLTPAGNVVTYATAVPVHS